jgi:hypothetical protein
VLESCLLCFFFDEYSVLRKRVFELSWAQTLTLCAVAAYAMQ